MVCCEMFDNSQSFHSLLSAHVHHYSLKWHYNCVPDVLSIMASIHEKIQCITWFTEEKPTVVIEEHFNICVGENLGVLSRPAIGLLTFRKQKWLEQKSQVRPGTLEENIKCVNIMCTESKEIFTLLQCCK